ncbi:glutathione S-transferase theta-1-like [Bufo gargarizans]|uniref:glutathione S-transferase theta-1-like n=1 Tax=Bufo gargarizans TaxID=30331 RepID=UPI001CF421FA|nr:glutathione S-transferase theta-1-like [Bufo gargarizans]
MCDLTLYLDLMSQPCRSVYIFVEANDIPYKYQEVLLFKGEQMSEDFGKVNPLRKVPSLKDGDFLMGESTAMLLYLANKYKTPDHWYPADIQKRARVDEYLAWQHTNTRPHGSKLFWIKAMTPYLLGHEATPDTLDPPLCEFNATLATLQDTFLQNKLFLAGDKISMADLVAIVEIMQPFAAGIDVFEDKPKLSAWKQRVEDAIGADLFKKAHDKILRIKEMQNLPIAPELKERLKAKLEYFTRR